MLFVLAALLGLSKVLLYDLWAQVQNAQSSLAAAEQQLDGVMVSLSDFTKVQKNYQRYSPTRDEMKTIDLMEILALLDLAVESTAEAGVVSISENTV